MGACPFAGPPDYACFWRHAYAANVVLMTLGFILAGYQLVGFFVA